MKKIDIIEILVSRIPLWKDAGMPEKDMIEAVESLFKLIDESEEECEKCWNAICTPENPCCDCEPKQKIEKLDMPKDMGEIKINEIIDYLNKE